MARSLEKIKFGLKLRTTKKDNVLTLRMGTRKMVIPVEARLISSDEYVFLHIPPTAELMKISKSGLEVITKGPDAEVAVKTFRRRRRARNVKPVQMPSALADALRKMPGGYKLGYGEDGKPRLVKRRKRRATKKVAVAKTTRRKATTRKKRKTTRRRK
ncbi:MAG: hypothetical protein IH944_02005 [Armatimonadetes bacterium]|nr:hypothetical protein [Armatimonadota bacterium]